MTAEFIGERPTKRTLGYWGEITTWAHLREAAPDDWTVFYEPYLARGGSEGVQRLPDFVIVAPPHGVMILEVKGLDSTAVLVKDRSIYGDYRDGRLKNFTEQVRNQAQKLLSEINADPKVRDRFGMRNLNLSRALGFTQWSLEGGDGHALRTAPKGWEAWELIESSAYASPEKLVARITQALQQSAKSFDMPSLAADDAAAFVTWFKGATHRGRTDYAPLLAALARDMEDFTKDELRAYSDAMLSDRYWLDSPMSTGKTWLAKQYAIGRAQEGKRVAFLMERRTIADRLRREASQFLVTGGLNDLTAGANPILTVGTLSSVLHRFYPNWRKLKDLDDLSLRIVEAKESGEFTPFDVLVLDQAEDYLPKELKLLEVVGELVIGGLQSGKIKIFSDLRYQGRRDPELQDKLSSRLQEHGFVTPKPLRTNCRNPAPTTRYLNLLLQDLAEKDGVPVYSGSLEDIGEGAEYLRPVIRPYPATQWFPQWITGDGYPDSLPPGWFQVQELANELRRLREDGVAPQDIVVLTAMPRSAYGEMGGILGAVYSSPAYLQKGMWDWSRTFTTLKGAVTASFDPKKPLDMGGLGSNWIPQDGRDRGVIRNDIQWYTVDEYRGGEAKVVILTDLDQQTYMGPKKRALVAGVSRNTARVVVIANVLSLELLPEGGTTKK